MMSGELVWIIVAVSAVGTASLVGIARSYALQNGLVDIPNARSSHTGTVPRGGGVAFVVIVLAAAVIIAGFGKMSFSDCVAWVGGGAAVALVGYLDDHRHLDVSIRLFVHG